MNRNLAIVPAHNEVEAIAATIASIRRWAPEFDVLVVDDGSTDATGAVARARGVRVVRQPENRGKGEALVRGFEEARSLGYDVALTVDADGQHPAESAREVFYATSEPRDLVLGVRDLVREGAPRANRISNGISNFFLSTFARRPLRDTQCGLRSRPRSCSARAPRASPSSSAPSAFTTRRRTSG
jgi:glycosyltransferase involved in cell wall biosynthesis